ncbi:hypothetical protein [Mycobacterium avium]|uniref:hypothetical protein n=1 Tax=Mycobacterium avium TaxID=1764 RepID=UPI001CC59779|nr:hypothetical protein [Mycobacterium avium]MBZ4518149.1 hypothetical protein [Mycobacterium avium subsp. hominissuis]MBZ4527931.1 hypothetical protein [Mycobacterium avium subsp. hominissuis]MBZ4547397.1 hypothetical protein [Mycobacterium avium subsp. hominissuis]MBZ4556889.1 hypothetical protein [Mycobacterium avium subsp. hominissuis]MBZ4566495.1 hypothetical protein [Mycobacterium avium subsp. hominissuis]
MSKAARKTRRRNRLSRLPNLPKELRTFDNHLYTRDGDPTGLRDYLAVLSDAVRTDQPVAVMNAAGLSAADWYRWMLGAA